MANSAEETLRGRAVIPKQKRRYFYHYGKCEDQLAHTCLIGIDT